MDAVPEDLRCKRSDGKQWRCSAPSMPDKTVCEKHYVQAKKRAASSALRATLRRSSPSYAAASYAPPREGDADADLPLPMAVARPFYGSVVGEPVYVAEPAVRRGLPLINAIGSRTAAELVGRASVGLQGCAEVKTSCHQCRRSVNAVWCTSCDRRGYCGGCISRWYSDIAIDDIQKVCPACRGICNCKVCLQGDNVIKARVQEISVVDKLKYLHSILAYVLPVLKQIYSDQCFEIGVETRAYGPKMDIIRAKMNSDEQMCCDFCKVPVFDYHRHCPRCLYDLCLDCCRDIRRSQTNVVRGEYAESKGPVVETNKNSASDRARLEPSAASVNDKLFPEPIDANDIGIRSLFPTWRANNDGSITCGPHEAGGCGSSKLVLRRIFKINWIGKLVKSSQEMVNGCKAHDLENGCSSCHDSRRLDSIGRHNFGLSKCSDSDGIDGNSVYSSVLENLKYEGIVHFRKHWINGEPVIIRNAFEPSLSSSWDPLSIWRGIQEIMDEKMDENAIVKAVDCSNQSEVHMLMHRAEMRYLCPKSLQPEQPERIANGMAVHVNAHAPVQNLNLDMGEQSPEHTVSKSCGPSAGSSAELSSSSHSEQAKTNGVERSQPGALWDVFRRQDVPMLNKYLASNWEELTNNSQAMLSVKHPIYDQAVYLREHHKRVLKDQYGIEPRTFEQHIGEAVFIPAGCPYQVKNLQSTVQLALDFLSPESLRESARMAQEIRCLPNHHDAKLKMLEVGKIALYAASSAVKEIQKITLDPKFNLDIRFEDQNLTRAVSENLARVTKQRKVSCG
ncbi:lysine-specific demethylase JMJ25 isoform X2 [Triticum urartu]|uniref:lysine-specific demethylase JMJ25 isoform X2 n=1 Tax=Triticum urartu TaxID=4572 RepID=UPI002043560D|nr:lysine-specific demethylase JMJ25 isoform X2 [Triticum urartu]